MSNPTEQIKRDATAIMDRIIYQMTDDRETVKALQAKHDAAITQLDAATAMVPHSGGMTEDEVNALLEEIGKARDLMTGVAYNDELAKTEHVLRNMARAA